MISRYSRPEMSWVWNDRHRYLVWLKVELAVCEELARQKWIPEKDWADLQKKAKVLVKDGGVDPQRVEELEKITRHDVIAFTTAVAEKVSPSARYIHFGLTSSDVVDTSLSLLIQQAGELLVKDIQVLLKTLEKKAKKYQELPTIGRSHGIFAEPTSFGLKFLGWHCEWQRNLARLQRSLEELRVGKLSGAVGTCSHWTPDVEKKMLAQLDLKAEPVSTQILPRDRHAEFLSVLAICGSSLERMAVELRHLQRSEVDEVQEGFQSGQKGSSAMPHKRNPISSENISGCARLLRSYAQAALENISLWHERDISHSSVERVILPDATLVLDYSLDRMNRVLDQLVVKTEKVHQNLKQAGSTVYSGHVLLELVKKGVTREDAYGWVQSCALASLQNPKSEFVDLLIHHPEIKKHLNADQIKKIGSLNYQLRNVDAIYERALKGNGKRN